MAQANANQRSRAAIKAALQREAGRAVEFLQELIRRSRGGEDAIQDHVAAALGELGCRIELLRYRPADVPLIEEFATGLDTGARERRSVVGIRPGSGGGRSLMLFAHPDPEPVAGIERWRHDPFAATIDKGRLYGWGAADDLAGVAMMVQGLRIALAAGLQPAGDLILASTPSKQHARGVAAVLRHGWHADAAVYLHPAESGIGMREIKSFASGQLEFQLTIEGRPPDSHEPAHTAFAHQAVNPLDKAWIVYRALKELDESRGKRVHHRALHAAVGRSTNLQVSFIHCGDAARLSRLDSRCVMGCAVSFPPPEQLSDIQREVEDALSTVAAADPWLRDHPPVVDWIAGVGAAETAAEHPLYKTAASAIKAIAGESTRANPLHTASDIRNPIIQNRIPTVGLGPLCGDLTMAGGHDEWVDVADYTQAAGVVAAIIADWCGGGWSSPRGDRIM